MEEKKFVTGSSKSKQSSSDSKWCKTSLRDGKLTTYCPRCDGKLTGTKFSTVHDIFLQCEKCARSFTVPYEIPRSTKEVGIHTHDVPIKLLEKLSQMNSLAIDFETGCTVSEHGTPCSEHCALNEQKGQLQQVQVSTPDGEVHIIRMPDKDSEYLKKILMMVPLKIVHYSNFEMKWTLAQLGIEELSGIWLCTRIGHTLAVPGANHSLGNIVMSELGHEVPKEDKVYLNGWNQPKLNDRQIEYSVNDVIYLHALANRIKAYLGSEVVGWYKMCKLQQAIVTIESEGFSRDALNRV